MHNRRLFGSGRRNAGSLLESSRNGNGSFVADEYTVIGRFATYEEGRARLDALENTEFTDVISFDVPRQKITSLACASHRDCPVVARIVEDLDLEPDDGEAVVDGQLLPFVVELKGVHRGSFASEADSDEVDDLEDSLVRMRLQQSRPPSALNATFSTQFTNSTVMSANDLADSDHGSLNTTNSTNSAQASGSSGFDDAAHQHVMVILTSGWAHGIEFEQCATSNLPCVVTPGVNYALPGMCQVRAGDYLVSVNDERCSSMAFEDVMEALDAMPRPVSLIFRRPIDSELEQQSQRNGRAHMRANSGVADQAKLDQQAIEAKFCFAVWQEHEDLGIEFEEGVGHAYPIVSSIAPRGVGTKRVVRDKLKVGDWLLSVNNLDLNALGSFSAAMLRVMRLPRPLAMTFLSAAGQQTERSCEL
ncbi:TPA: hypothetical protein N0F65_012252 [Lagenidium giganteum]|uniref:PDZ domain-containing protein n=1 Tax=Lagenidium giganteum TaxID=4803 RepID=A0AAV2ZIX4_9STRA|nr:TPA: hypothetical protein N0F65_012252 [Lagenidium giganteum]